MSAFWVPDEYKPLVKIYVGPHQPEYLHLPHTGEQRHQHHTAGVALIVGSRWLK